MLGLDRGDVLGFRDRADAYGRDADFYAFTRWLEAYGKVMDPVTMLIMDTDREFLKFLKRPR